MKYTVVTENSELSHPSLNHRMIILCLSLSINALQKFGLSLESQSIISIEA